MSQSIQQLIDRIQKRMAARKEANKRDQAELWRLEAKAKQEAAKTLAGAQVVLNPNKTIQHPELRKLRGMVATVERVGRAYHHIVFANSERWRVGFDLVVPATPENTTAETLQNGEQIDRINDSLSAAFK